MQALQRSIECFRVAILIRKGPSALEGGLPFPSSRVRRSISGVEDEVALRLKMERQSGGAGGSIRTGLYLSTVELSLQHLVITLIHILHSCKRQCRNGLVMVDVREGVIHIALSENKCPERSRSLLPILPWVDIFRQTVAELRRVANAVKSVTPVHDHASGVALSQGLVIRRWLVCVLTEDSILITEFSHIY